MKVAALMKWRCLAALSSISILVLGQKKFQKACSLFGRFNLVQVAAGLVAGWLQYLTINVTINNQ